MNRLAKKAISVTGEYKTCCAKFRSAQCKSVFGNCTACAVNDSAWDKLSAYEDAEEQGRMIVLPFAMDSKAYILVNKTGFPIEGGNLIAEGAIYSVEFNILSGARFRVFSSDKRIFSCDTEFPLENIGKIVFLTREEAEAALEAQKGGE